MIAHQVLVLGCLHQASDHGLCHPEHILGDDVAMFQTHYAKEARLSTPLFGMPLAGFRTDSDTPKKKLKARYVADISTSPASVALPIVFIALGILATGYCMRDIVVGGAVKEDVITSDTRSTYMSAKATPTKRKSERRAGTFISEDKSSRWDAEQSYQTSSIRGCIICIIADIAPPGILHQMAHIGYAPLFILLALVTLLCGYTFWLHAILCEISGRKDVQSQWRTLIGPRTRWVPLVVTTLVCFGNVLEFTCFFTDILTLLLRSSGVHISRSLICVMFSCLPVLPLCLLKDFSALEPSSILGCTAVLFTVVMMVVRACDGSYAPGGTYFESLSAEMKPAMPKNHYIWGFGMPVFAVLNSHVLSYLTHYNADKYYREMVKPTPARFALLTGLGFGLCAIIYIVCAITSFQTFGFTEHEPVLTNYSDKDIPMKVAQLATAFSLLMAYPIAFCALREAMVAFGVIAVPSMTLYFESNLGQDLISIFFVTLVTIAAILMENAGTVVGLVGAICCSLIMFIIPCMLMIAALYSGIVAAQNHKLQIIANCCLMALGVAILILGTETTLAEAE